MEERHDPSSILLIGEHPSETATIQHALSEVGLNPTVTVARHHQDVSRSLGSCELSSYRVAFFIPSSLEDGELLTIVRSSPGSSGVRLVVLLRPELSQHTKTFYVRGAHSVVLWPDDPVEREQLAERLAVYWEVTNLPSVSTAVPTMATRIGVA